MESVVCNECNAHVRDLYWYRQNKIKKLRFTNVQLYQYSVCNIYIYIYITNTIYISHIKYLLYYILYNTYYICIKYTYVYMYYICIICVYVYICIKYMY